MNYEQYSAKDFAADEHFVRWVKNPDQQIDSFWHQWLLKHAEKKAVIEEAKQIVQLFEFKDRAETPDRVKAILERINATTHSPKITPQSTKNYPLWSFTAGWQKVAASLIGILLISTVIFFLYRGRTIEYSTAFGEKQEIILPDSSKVILNANSKLSFNNEWRSGREVWLQGEAFFSVRKKKISNQEGDFLKFTVHTHTLDVEVLGTEFNVSDRRQNTIVVLNSGKIQLSLPDKEENIFMKPGDLVEMAGQEQKVTKKVVDPTVYNAWTNNEWILNDLTLKEVALKIEETYGVKVDIKNKSKRDHVLAGVVPTDNLDVLLKVLSTTLHIKITQHKNQIIIQ